MRLIIHIGPKKTGTTALQRYLNQNKQELSTRYQICYPTPLFGGEAHHELIYGINYQLTGAAPYAEAQGVNNIPHPREIFQRYIEQAAELHCNTIIISSETLFELNEKQQELLQKSVEGIDEIEYVFGLRDRVSLILSRWQEEVKHGYTKSLSEYIERNLFTGPNAADYYQKILDISLTSGIKNLRVKPFLYGGYEGEQSIFLEFLAALGISHVGLNLQIEEINIGVKSGPLIALMAANHWIEAQNALMKSTHPMQWLRPISRALDLREYVLKNTHIEGKQYSLLSLLVFSDNKLESFKKLNELVNFSLRDFQHAYPDKNHGEYEQKLRTEIEDNLNQIFEINLHEFRSHLEKHESIGIKLAEEFSTKIQ